ncbi:MAG: glycosyltransferase [Chloroflexia bacterium]
MAIHRQICALAKLGCMQKVISPAPWVPWPFRHLSAKWRGYSEVPAREVRDGVEVYIPRYAVFPRAIWLASSGWRMYWAVVGIVGKISREFPFDLIHAHTALPDGYAAMLLSKRYRKPLIVTFRASDLDIAAKKSPACFRALRSVATFARRTICPSPRLAKVMATSFGIQAKVICNGIDPGVIDAGDGLLLGTEHRVVVSVSRLIATKGIDGNLRAIALLRGKYPNLMYWVVGDGPERPALERLASDLGLRSMVEFVGQVPHEEAIRYMKSAEVFSLPSWQETFGLAYLEAMACGKPVIAVLNQGIDGIVVPGETGLLVRPRDLESLTEALDFLLGHPEEAKAMGERARKKVLENFTWQKNAEETARVYREVLSEA